MQSIRDFQAGVPVLKYGFQTKPTRSRHRMGRTGTQYNFTGASVSSESCLFDGTEDQIVDEPRRRRPGRAEGFTVPRVYDRDPCRGLRVARASPLRPAVAPEVGLPVQSGR